MKRNEREWIEEFKSFVDSDDADIPKDLSRTILSKVKSDLNPSVWRVFGKLLAIHVFVGTLSLGICSQFGLNPFGSPISLADYFMRFGHSACMVFCGFLFIGLTIILAGLFMSREEFYVLSKNAVLQTFGISIFSLVMFIVFGAEVVLWIGILWMFGAMVGGVSSAKILLSLRSV